MQKCTTVLASIVTCFLLLGPLVARAAEDYTWDAVEDFELLKQEIVDRSSLKDPFSVQFRRVKSRFIAKTGSTLYCGEINAKNSMGAYIGFQWFFFIVGEGSDSDITLFDPESTYAKADLFMIKSLCRGSPIGESVQTLFDLM